MISEEIAMPESYRGNNGGDPCPPGWHIPTVAESYALVYGQREFDVVINQNNVAENGIDVRGNGQLANYTADYRGITANSAVVGLRFKNTPYASAFMYKMVNRKAPGAHLEIRAKLVNSGVTVENIAEWTEAEWSDAIVRYLPNWVA
jgi:hypothetical protein